VDTDIKGGEMRHLINITLFSGLIYFLSGATFITSDASLQIDDSEKSRSDIRLYMASFNIETFDLTNPDTLALLADIISRFEIVALQNILPHTIGSAMDNLIEETQAYGHPYEFLIDTSHVYGPSGYAFVYRPDMLYPIQWYTFSESHSNGEVNTAFIARFEHNDGEYNISLINYQSNDLFTSNEGEFLQVVYNDIKEKNPDELDIIFLGLTHFDCLLSSLDSSIDRYNHPDFLCLIDPKQLRQEEIPPSLAPQIIFASYSDELYWEEGDIFRIEESNALGDTQPFSIGNQPGFTGIVVVNTAEETNQGSKSKGFCFFSSTFN
jgi:hypothetical protein